ncbi:MAG: tetratricopeptide repeat protein [Dysgonamonadaceae bacterium]|jgi:tetratricopeptide (TPR) repeat protein|nr:tetratricopeptide repeat protein [Dysgonamonadaceae bacterium]
MAKKTVSAPAHAEAQVGEIFSKSEKFIETYRNHILAGAAFAVLIVVAVVGIRKYYLEPKEQEAQAALFPGENYFQNREWDKALNGDSAICTGFLAVADEYRLTKAGKLANAYAGLCYYHLGNYGEAEAYLKKYRASDNVLSPALKSTIGDCHASLGNVEKAIAYFKQAAEEAGDKNLSPIYLKKAATAYESLSDYKNALDIYKQIKNKYPASGEAQAIDKYIERAKLLQTK